MQHIRKIILALIFILPSHIYGQITTTAETADIKSYELYQAGNWQQLLKYGKEVTTSGVDFLYLRLRMAYAAFMMNNFSEAIVQYDKVLYLDAENATAHYYKWLCRKYLNHSELAARETRFLSEEVKKDSKISSVALTLAGVEASYKYTDFVPRGNSIYTRADAGLQLGSSIHMLQSAGLYNQTISETQFTAVTNNTNIAINQKEYYNKTTISMLNKWQLKLAYHYLYTPFNNFVYNNHIGLVGIKFYGSYFDIQANAIVSKLTDSTRQQYELKTSIYPLGNLNLYFLTTGIYRKSNESKMNVKQVIGFKLLKNTWLELNGTFGKFNNLFENDALYVYNSVDPNLIKAGSTLYFTLTPHLLVQMGYSFEQREVYKKTTLFNQHSITGGISWKM